MDVWHELGIASTRDRREIKKAYAAKLKIIKPDRNPQAFYTLRKAYELALKLADDSNGGKQWQGLMRFSQSYGQKTPFSSIKPDTSSKQKDDYHMARQWADKIIQALKRSESLALHYFQQAVRQEEMLNIETKSWLEDLLVRRIANTKPFPYRLAEEIDKKFEWTQQLKQIRGRANLQLEYVSKRLSAHRYIYHLREQARKGKLPYSDRIAIEVLGGDLDTRRYAWLLRSRGITNRIHYWLEEFARRRPEVIHHELNQQVVAWWRQSAKHVKAQGFHVLSSLLITLLSYHFLAKDMPELFLIGVFPVVFLLLLSVDIIAVQWRYHWRDALEKWYGGIRAVSTRHDTLYRLFWCVLLTGFILTGKWFSPIGTIVALTMFYAMMTMVVNWKTLFYSSLFAYASLLAIQWWAHSLSAPMTTKSYQYFLQAGFVGMTHLLGPYLIYLSFVLIYSGIFIVANRRKDMFF